MPSLTYQVPYTCGDISMHPVLFLELLTCSLILFICSFCLFLCQFHTSFLVLKLYKKSTYLIRPHLLSNLSLLFSDFVCIFAISMPSAKIPFLLFSTDTSLTHSLRSNSRFSKKPSLIVLTWSDLSPLWTLKSPTLYFTFTFHQTTIAQVLWGQDPCLTSRWFLRIPSIVTFIQKLFY